MAVNGACLRRPDINAGRPTPDHATNSLCVFAPLTRLVPVQLGASLVSTALVNVTDLQFHVRLRCSRPSTVALTVVFILLHPTSQTRFQWLSPVLTS